MERYPYAKGDGSGLHRAKKSVPKQVQTTFDLIKCGEPAVTFSIHGSDEIFVASVRKGTTDRIWMLMTAKEAKKLWKKLVTKGYRRNK